MNYISVCSGIEAATVAWHPLGWKAAAFAEIEKFPSAVLKHHYPDVPNVGDFTKIGSNDHGTIDLLVGGTPCQDFSVAGLRAGMDGQRGQLTIEFAHLAARLRTRWLAWENVPGVLSIDGGRAFGTFLGLLGKLGYGLAYRVLDAQHFGVPQRRRRVFVVGYLGDWRRAAAVLFERQSLSGYPPPSREKGQGTTYDVAPCIGASGRGFDRPGDARGQDCLVPCETEVTSTLDASYGRLQGCSGQDANHGHSHLVAFGGNNTAGPIDLSTAVNAHGGPSGRLDFESETFITHALRADGFDASEDGTGRGTPLVPVFGLDQEFNSSEEQLGTLKVGGKGGFCAPTVAFSCKDHGADVGELSPTLRSMGHDGSHANAGGQVAVMTLAIRGREGEPSLEVREDGIANAVLTPNGGRGGIGVGAVAIGLGSYPTVGDDLAAPSTGRNGHPGVVAVAIHENQRAEISVSDTAGSLKVGGGKPGQGYPAMFSGMQVRRLTPRECEQLHSFPDDYTKISDKTADGPRYKALGNSMAVPVMRWIGERIQLVEGRCVGQRER